jgi:hypothetical protein
MNFLFSMLAACTRKEFGSARSFTPPWCIYMYIHTYIYTYIYIFVCVCVCIYVYVYVYMHMHTYFDANTSIVTVVRLLYIHINIYIHTYIIWYEHLCCHGGQIAVRHIYPTSSSAFRNVLCIRTPQTAVLPSLKLFAFEFGGERTRAELISRSPTFGFHTKFS